MHINMYECSRVAYNWRKNETFAKLQIGEKNDFNISSENLHIWKYVTFSADFVRAPDWLRLMVNQRL